MKKLSLSFILALVICAFLAVPAFAADFTATVNGAENTKLASNDSFLYKTDLKAGSVVEIKSQTEISKIYVVWYKVPGEWTLNDTQTINDGFLQELITLEQPSTTVKMTIKDASACCYIRVFGADEKLPDNVIAWEAPQENVDVLVFSTHADDETLFLGGAMADILGHYPDARIQLVYMTNHIALEPFRENERLEALKTYKLKTYPIVGFTADAYAMDTLEAGLAVCDYDRILADFVDIINKYKPQVIITQDFNGEYGHAQHIVMTKAVTEAVEKCAADGTWDVPKTYVHLYKDSGAIELDLRQPLDFYGGKTALDVEKEAYLKHESQQRWWFYVSDDYKYSCDEFGLWRTALPADTGNDMMENIKLYKVQEEEEAARKAAEEAEKTTAKKSHADKDQNRSPERGQVLLKILIAVASVAAVLIIAVVALRIYNRRRYARRRRRGYSPKHGQGGRKN
ncbi:MAG: PIG-L family deacetylase [Clostridia bacterium]|nr:PIG-L family deacetylase [Clostridia bacterium]